MRKTLLLLLAAAAMSLAPARGQNIALGERVPELRVQKWLADREPAEAPMTYVEFYHSSSRASTASLERLRELSAKMGDRLRIVVLVREPETEIGPQLEPYLSERLSVGFDPTGRTFAAYGVSYVPFGVLIGPRNRARWMGNTLQLTPEIIENIE
ncbi:MAG: hypothetical protein NC209_03545 [Alistipes sp.]|nr:hypothetical protein [Alistipes senegalensis]MCM1250204.1 hypothetical protein [Alistipes sp.]